jgi:hypothetical protein
MQLLIKKFLNLSKKIKFGQAVENGGTKWFKVPDHYDIETETRIKHLKMVKNISVWVAFIGLQI